MAEAKELNPADIPPEFDSAIYTRAFNTAAAGGEHPFGNPFEAGSNAAASWDAGFAAGAPPPDPPITRRAKTED